MHAARLSLVLALGAVVAATTTAGATVETGRRIHKVPPPKKPPAAIVIGPGVSPPTIVLDPAAPAAQDVRNPSKAFAELRALAGPQIVITPGDAVIVPAPAVPPQLIVVVPDVAFADARAYPLGMLLEAAPTVHRRIIIMQGPADPAPPLAPLIPMALSLCGLGVIGFAFAAGRRRGAAGSLAHPLGSL